MKTLDMVFVKLAKVMNSLAAIGLFLVMLVAVLNILLRVIANSPILGTYEIVQYGILTAVSLGLADNELANGNVMVSFFLEKMKPKMANIFSIVTTLVGVICCSAVSWNLGKLVFIKYAQHAASAVLGLPHWIIVLVLTMGFVTQTLALVLKIIRMIYSHKDLPDQQLSAEERLLQSSDPGGNQF